MRKIWCWIQYWLKNSTCFWIVFYIKLKSVLLIFFEKQNFLIEETFHLLLYLKKSLEMVALLILAIFLLEILFYSIFLLPFGQKYPNGHWLHLRLYSTPYDLSKNTTKLTTQWEHRGRVGFLILAPGLKKFSVTSRMFWSQVITNCGILRPQNVSSFI